jgi:DNA-directed RNA polymerase specialized sigma24 family protein
MNPNQIVTKYYSFIIQKAKLINQDTEEANDLAHDVCETILKSDKETIDKLLTNPEGYIYRMIVNQFINSKKRLNIGTKVKSELLYISDRVSYLGMSFESGKKWEDIIKEVSERKDLTQLEKELLAIVLIYPTEREFARKTTISRKYSKIYIDKLKDKLYD